MSHIALYFFGTPSRLFCELFCKFINHIPAKALEFFRNVLTPDLPSLPLLPGSSTDSYEFGNFTQAEIETLGRCETNCVPVVSWILVVLSIVIFILLTVLFLFLVAKLSALVAGSASWAIRANQFRLEQKRTDTYLKMTGFKKYDDGDIPRVVYQFTFDDELTKEYEQELIKKTKIKKP